MWLAESFEQLDRVTVNVLLMEEPAPIPAAKRSSCISRLGDQNLTLRFGSMTDSWSEAIEPDRMSQH